MSETNNEKIKKVYSNLIEILLELSEVAEGANDYDKIDEALESIDTITVILKRIGETQVLEEFEEAVEKVVPKEPPFTKKKIETKEELIENDSSRETEE